MSKRQSVEEKIVDWFERASGPEARLMLAIINRVLRNRPETLGREKSGIQTGFRRPQKAEVLPQSEPRKAVDHGDPDQARKT